ncbi:hypothetical protein SNEBB_005896 [Seison nebaliae]|nr:hypothetical protein SNEBB_005896 [Seison nebaliae]
MQSTSIQNATTTHTSFNVNEVLNGALNTVQCTSPFTGSKRRKQDSPLLRGDDHSSDENTRLRHELEVVKERCRLLERTVAALTTRMDKVEATPGVPDSNESRRTSSTVDSELASSGSSPSTSTSASRQPEDKTSVVRPLPCNRHYRNALTSNMGANDVTKRLDRQSAPKGNRQPIAPNNVTRKRNGPRSSKASTKGSSTAQPQLVRERRVSVLAKGFINSIRVEDVVAFLSAAGTPPVTVARLQPKNPEIPFNSTTFHIAMKASHREIALRSNTWPEGISVSRLFYNDKAKEFLTNRFKTEYSTSA